MAEVGNSDLVVVGQIEAEFAGTGTTACRSPRVEVRPAVALLNLMHDAVSGHDDLESPRLLLVALERNLGFLAFLSIAYFAAIEEIVIHLEQSVIPIVGVVENPLQHFPLVEDRAENVGARRA